MEKDAFYFPHFSNARQDRKIRRLRKDLGLEGYGAYFMILEVLREQPLFKYPLEDLDLLSDEIGLSEAKLKTIISKYSLFIIDDENFFLSLKFIEFLTPYIEAKKKRSIDGIKGNLIKYNYLTKDQLNKMTGAEIIEYNNNKDHQLSIEYTSDVGGDVGGDTGGGRKESKGKEKKEKETKENEIKIGYTFENFFSDYDKNIKEEASREIFYSLDYETRELIKEHLPTYIHFTPDKQYRKNPLNYLLDKTWKDEVIDTTKTNGNGNTNSKEQTRADINEYHRKIFDGTIQL